MCSLMGKRGRGWRMRNEGKKVRLGNRLGTGVLDELLRMTNMEHCRMDAGGGKEAWGTALRVM